MAILSSMAVQCGYFRTNGVMLASVYVGQIYCLQISELASMKQPKDSLQLAKPTRNSRKIANKLTTVASGEINMQSNIFLVCHVPKVKAATSAHSMADAIPFLIVYLYSQRKAVAVTFTHRQKKKRQPAFW